MNNNFTLVSDFDLSLAIQDDPTSVLKFRQSLARNEYIDLPVPQENNSNGKLDPNECAKVVVKVKLYAKQMPRAAEISIPEPLLPHGLKIHYRNLASAIDLNRELKNGAHIYICADKSYQGGGLTALVHSASPGEPLAYQLGL